MIFTHRAVSADCLTCVLQVVIDATDITILFSYASGRVALRGWSSERKNTIPGLPETMGADLKSVPFKQQLYIVAIYQ